MTYTLDACALLSLLNEEVGKGYETVRELLDRAAVGEIVLLMNLVNLVEVYYRFIQLRGVDVADVVMEPVKSLPIKFVSTITDDIYSETARFKALYSISLADAFLCATTKNFSATIVTKDKELKAPEEAGEFSVLWLK